MKSILKKIYTNLRKKSITPYTYSEKYMKLDDVYDEIFKEEKEYNERCITEIRNKVIDEVLEVVKRTYHNFSGYDLEFMQKYGNPTNSLQRDSYGTFMMYEIANEFDDLIDNLEQMKGM